MPWFSDRQTFLLAVLLYGLSMVYSFFLWRRGFREDNRTNYCILFAGFLFHTGAMIQRGFDLKHCPVNNLYEAITFLSWTIVTAYLVIGLWRRLRFLGAFASPVLFCIGVFALMPALDSVHGAKPEFRNGSASLHAALILLSYGAFGLSSVAGLMYLSQEHDLKFHKLRAVFSLMPSIERLELVMSRLLQAGFILLTSGLVVGALWVTPPPETRYFADPKVLWSILVWLLYLALLLMRWQFSQGGRRLAWGAIGSFVFVLLTFWGVNLLSPMHQP